MKHTTTTAWQGDMRFTTTLNEQKVDFDVKAPEGKIRQGVSPKEMLLSSLAGCSGIDVVALLNDRYKVPFSDLNIVVSGELTEKHPKYYRQIHIVYQIKVAATDQDKVRQAVEASLETYCGVHAMLAEAAGTTYEIHYLSA
ncbi:MAG: OsmC family protein [Bacteroidota bacterium]